MFGGWRDATVTGKKSEPRHLRLLRLGGFYGRDATGADGGMILIGADIHLVMPATLAFLAFGARDFDGRKAVEVFPRSFRSGMVGRFDLRYVQQFLKWKNVVDHPGGNAIVE